MTHTRYPSRDVTSALIVWRRLFRPTDKKNQTGIKAGLQGVCQRNYTVMKNTPSTYIRAYMRVNTTLVKKCSFPA